MLINWKHLWIYTINQLWFHSFTCWTLSLSLTASTFKFVFVSKSIFLQTGDGSFVMNMYVGFHWLMEIFFLTRELTNSKEEIAYLKRALKDQVILWLINSCFLVPIWEYFTHLKTSRFIKRTVELTSHFYIRRAGL